PASLTDRLGGAEPLGPALACGPLRVKAKRVYGDKTLLVGDAAGYVDAITGEGMSLALSTAGFAAEAAVATLRDGVSMRAAFRRYAQERARVFRDHALLTHGLVFLARHPVLVRRAIGRLAHEPSLFTRLLEVNDGRRSFLSLGVVDLLKLGVGRSPATAS
ncbi:MAG: NAD(P)/FAD-dependent oxidoreductase, partial [Myxococcota bacterium]